MHFFHDDGLSEKALRFRYCDFGSLVYGIAVYARTDCGEADGARFVEFRQLETCCVAAAEQFGFAVLAIAINRADGMEYPLGGKLARMGDHGAPSGATVEAAEFLHERWPTGAVDGTVHSAAASESGVGRVNDGVYWEARDVAQFDAEQLAGGGSPIHRAILAGRL